MEHEGDVRIRRNDRLGFVVQKLVLLSTGKNAGTLAWQDVGCYSHVEGAARRAYALQQALLGCIDDGANGESAKELLDSIHRLEARLPQIIRECDVYARPPKEKKTHAEA